MKKKNLWKYRRILSLICLTAIIAGMLGGCGRGTGEETLPTIIVGCDHYPPFSYLDARGEITGIDADLAREAFRRMGYAPQFTFIEWENKKSLVESGQIDCIWSSFSINGREADYNWTTPYMTSRQVVAVRMDSSIQHLSDLEGKRVAVQSTTKPEGIFLSRQDPRIPEVEELFCLQNRELLYPYLSKGYVDAIAAHETAIIQCMQDYKLNYRILEEPLMEVGLGVAFSGYDTRGLEQELSKVFEQMREDGTMAQIIGKYLAEPERFMGVSRNEN